MGRHRSEHLSLKVVLGEAAGFCVLQELDAGEALIAARFWPWPTCPHCKIWALVKPIMPQELGAGIAMHIVGVWQASTPKPGSKILSSYNVFPAPSTDKV